MILSLTKSVVLLTYVSTLCQAAVVTYNWNITYVTANPDGLFERRVIGINGAFPPPPINVTMNDTLVINVVNQLDVSTSLHAHGLFQTGNGPMDGAAMVTQCPIPPNANFTYTIPIEQHGTYWIHGHHKGQYVDGLRAPLIIHNSGKESYQYDEEYTVGLSDWYHEEQAVLLKQYLSPSNPSGMEPQPQSGLINHQKDAKFNFVPGKTYRLRVINMSALATFQFHIDGHDLDIVEVDGVDVQRATVKTLPIASGQRYSVLVKARNDTSFNYALHGDMIMHSSSVHPPTTPTTSTTSSMDHGGHSPPTVTNSPEMPHTPDMTDTQVNTTGTIIYNPSSPLAPTESPGRPEFDDATLLVPIETMVTHLADKQFTLTAEMRVLDDNTHRPIFNNITYMKPKVPSLYTALSMATGDLSSNPDVYGKHSLPMVIKHNSWAEIVINNNDAGDHPFHLHGHVFQVVGRTDHVHDTKTSPYPYFNLTNPLRRDTVTVPAMSSVAIRFQANNPGVWFFHCHMEWHAKAGLAATVIEAPEVLSTVLKIDPRHTEQCAAAGIPFEGNAAGNQGLDLTGENVGPNPLGSSSSGSHASSPLRGGFLVVFATLLSLTTVMVGMSA
ncbi:hypothetical protein BG004_000569 [Podila humilis]|nr:hypothetical protein BG004_000569 [Podila humilis]